MYFLSIKPPTHILAMMHIQFFFQITFLGAIFRLEITVIGYLLYYMHYLVDVLVYIVYYMNARLNPCPAEPGYTLPLQTV